MARRIVACRAGLGVVGREERDIDEIIVMHDVPRCPVRPVVAGGTACSGRAGDRRVDPMPPRPVRITGPRRGDVVAGTTYNGARREGPGMTMSARRAAVGNTGKSRTMTVLVGALRGCRRSRAYGWTVRQDDGEPGRRMH
jgi:hypothetical protein